MPLDVNRTPYYLRRARVLTRRPIPDHPVHVDGRLDHSWHAEKQDTCQDGDVFLQTCRCGVRRSIFVIFDENEPMPGGFVAR